MIRLESVSIFEIFPPAKLFSEGPSSLINVLLPLIYTIAGIITFLLIAGGGFMMIQGANDGDSQQMDRGKQALTYAVVGLVIIFGSFFFIRFLEGFVGQEFL